MADHDADAVHADANADRDIYLSIHNLIQKQEAQRKQGKQLTPSIYRVPEILRNVNKLSYDPRVLSIGPFHKKNINLKRLEANKVSYVCNLFHRLNSPQDKALEVCEQKVLDRIDQIKSCYEGGVEEEDYQNKKLAEMMVIDGCFILEVIYASYKKKYDSHSFFDIYLVSLYVKHDLVLLENQIPFFVLEDLFRCTISLIERNLSLVKLHDLVLLENQIPFFVLEDLFRCTISLIERNLSLVKLVLEFLEDINPFSEKKLVANIHSADTNHDHILALLHKCYQPMDAAETSQERLRESKLTAMSYSAADLSRAGVKFAPNKIEKSILTMEFKVPRLSFHCFSMGKPTFFMPVLTIEDYTESFFRNLIVYEQLTPATSKHITSYAFAMDCLLDSQEDVQKVIGSKVFVNNLGSTKEASDLFNNICKEVTVNDFSYEEQWKQVHNYYKGYWPKNVAFLRRTYFSNPWSLIGLLAATLLFALTAWEIVVEGMKNLASKCQISSIICRYIVSWLQRLKIAQGLFSAKLVVVLEAVLKASQVIIDPSEKVPIHLYLYPEPSGQVPMGFVVRRKESTIDEAKPIKGACWRPKKMVRKMKFAAVSALTNIGSVTSYNTKVYANYHRQDTDTCIPSVVVHNCRSKVGVEHRRLVEYMGKGRRTGSQGCRCVSQPVDTVSLAAETRAAETSFTPSMTGGAHTRTSVNVISNVYADAGLCDEIAPGLHRRISEFETGFELVSIYLHLQSASHAGASEHFQTVERNICSGAKVFEECRSMFTGNGTVLCVPTFVASFGYLIWLVCFLPAGALYDQTTFLTMAIVAADGNDIHSAHCPQKHSTL
ncbi:hypothetical protein CTI12_AA115060 [Artemisia annua]|uniref:Uncharacterized protein n=1 Tax=Artemisia annua TaxID=35608 RepID=A0A2U1PTJ9_ARTAN|nr:hypothetical protein CTI12_AA115060 [Artemisia annua]